MKGALDFMATVYGVFGFKFELELSTRPKKYLGDIEVWNKAEAQLKEVLDGWGRDWTLNPGDGAFYGPKIDIHIRVCIYTNTQRDTHTEREILKNESIGCIRSKSSMCYYSIRFSIT